MQAKDDAQRPPTCPRCGHSTLVRSSTGNGWVCQRTWTEMVPGRIIAVAPNMNPLAPGPLPGIPIFEQHPQTRSCGAGFTDVEVEEALRRLRVEDEQRELQDRRQQEVQRRTAVLERERRAALAELPPIDKPSLVDKSEIRGQGCAIGCGLWAVVIVVSLIMLALDGQLDSDSDPAILGVENPLLFLPVMWLTGWFISSIRLVFARGKYRAATAEADRRAEEHALVQADFDRRIAAVGREVR